MTIRAYCTTSQNHWSAVEDVSTISDLRMDHENLVWAEADVTDLEPGEERVISDEFGLDELAVEDAIHPKQRPKLEDYERHHFAVLQQLDEEEGQLEPRQISCFIGASYVLVIHHDADRTMEEVRRRVQDAKEPIRHPAFLLYTLLDTVVDEYLSLADDLEAQVETIEDDALQFADIMESRQRLDPPRHLHAQNLYRLKQKVARLRRFALPLENVVTRLLEHPDPDFVPKTMLKRFRDVYDHLVRLAAQARNVDELAQAVIELARAEQGKFLNEINKRLSSWAAILLVPTLIAGIYGMNFPLVPDGGEPVGFWFAVGLMLASSGILYVYFRNKEWL